MLPVSLPVTATADEEPVKITIDSVSATTLDLSKPQESVELKGTLTNTTTQPITWLNISLFRRTTPLTSTSELAAALAEPSGARLTSETNGNVALPVQGQFQPGQQVSFSVRATVAELGFTTNDAAYLLGVDVRGIRAQGTRQTLGRHATVIAATTSATSSSSLVMLTAPPERLPDGSFSDDSLLTELSGRLGSLLTSAERSGVVAAIDPALYDAAVALSQPHVVGDEEQEGSGVALSWVSRVDALAAKGALWRLPYGNPDLQRAQASGELESVLAWSETATTTLTSLPQVALVHQEPDDALREALGRFDTVIAVGASGAVEGKPRTLGAPVTNLMDVPVGLRLSRQMAEEVVAEQPILYVIDTVQEATADLAGGARRTHTQPRVTGNEDVAWLSPTKREAWPKVADALDQARHNATLQADLTQKPVDLSVMGSSAFSASFPNQDAALVYVSAASPVSIDLNDITLVASSSFVMGSRSNTFPATVTNGTKVPATVRLVFTSDAPHRIWVPPRDEATIAPGQSLTLNVSPEASANGVTMVHAQLYSLSGRSIGNSVAIEITATDFGRVGWIIIVVSGLVVVGGTAWRIRAVRRERAKEAAQ